MGRCLLETHSICAAKSPTSVIQVLHVSSCGTLAVVDINDDITGLHVIIVTVSPFTSPMKMMLRRWVITGLLLRQICP